MKNKSTIIKIITTHYFVHHLCTILTISLISSIKMFLIIPINCFVEIWWSLTIALKWIIISHLAAVKINVLLILKPKKWKKSFRCIYSYKIKTRFLFLEVGFIWKKINSYSFAPHIRWQFVRNEDELNSLSKDSEMMGSNPTLIWPVVFILKNL